MPKPVRLQVASSNPGKLREYRELAGGEPIQLETVPGIGALPVFDESAPTFAENSAGKAIHYSRFTDERVIADDSGLVVPALGGAPRVTMVELLILFKTRSIAAGLAAPSSFRRASLRSPSSKRDGAVKMIPALLTTQLLPLCSPRDRSFHRRTVHFPLSSKL